MNTAESVSGKSLGLPSTRIFSPDFPCSGCSFFSAPSLWRWGCCSSTLTTAWPRNCQYCHSSPSPWLALESSCSPGIQLRRRDLQATGGTAPRPAVALARRLGPGFRSRPRTVEGPLPVHHAGSAGWQTSRRDGNRRARPPVSRPVKSGLRDLDAPGRKPSTKDRVNPLAGTIGPMADHWPSISARGRGFGPWLLLRRSLLRCGCGRLRACREPQNKCSGQRRRCENAIQQLHRRLTPFQCCPIASRS